jgi:hypothetical protein
MEPERRIALATATAAAAVLLLGSVTDAQAAHPRIHAAIDSLREARDELFHAPNTFGGHKEAAIGAIDNAIQQLRICLDY